MRVTDRTTDAAACRFADSDPDDWVTEALAAAALSDDEQRLSCLIREFARGSASDRRSAVKIRDLERLVRRLSTASVVDSLTGLSNRRGFMRDGEHLLSRAVERRESAVLLFVDVDRLKQINDRHGHAVGDDLLRCAARVLRATFRRADVVARIGGDEFAALTRTGRRDAAPMILRRLRTALDAANAQRSDHPLAFSVGCAFYDPDGPASLGEMLREADRRMYASKRLRTTLAGSRRAALPLHLAILAPEEAR